MAGISVTSPEDRPSREQQIQRLAGLVPQEGNVKLRISVQMLEEESKQYTPLRESSWLIVIPKASLKPDTIEQFLDQLGVGIRALAQGDTTAEGTTTI